MGRQEFGGIPFALGTRDDRLWQDKRGRPLSANEGSSVLWHHMALVCVVVSTLTPQIGDIRE